MDKFTNEERVKIIEFYFENRRSIIGKQRSYLRHFNVRHSPTKPTIINLVKRFQEHGFVGDRSRPGRSRSERTPGKTENVRRSIKDEATTSTGRRSQELVNSWRSLQVMYLYKIQLVPSLQPLDMQQWLTYAVRFQKIARNDINFIHNLIMGDEAHFHLNGHVNKQNMKFWGTKNPRITHASELHLSKLIVWCGETSERVIGPYFFEHTDENAG